VLTLDYEALPAEGQSFGALKRCSGWLPLERLSQSLGISGSSGDPSHGTIPKSQSGKSPQPWSARSSEVSEVVSYLERIHYWIRFMGVVLLIQIILAVILMFFLWVS
jgi:hypothetical protein